MSDNIPPLQDGETKQELVDWLNGDRNERAGVPWPDDIGCHYCGCSLTERDIESLEGTREEILHSDSEYVHCQDCIADAQRHLCG